MSKLNKEQINEIRRLYSETELDMYQIAEKFKVGQPTIFYWIKGKDKAIFRAREFYSKLTKEQKRKRYEKSYEYLKNYLNNRYKNDPIFREKIKARNRVKKNE